MINQLGKINFPALNQYLWQPADFDLLQTYLNNFSKERLSVDRTQGLIFGGQITVVSGLTISIAKLTALMPDGQLVTFDTQTLTLPTANGSNPRLDRVELAYSLVNNTQVVNVAGQTVTLDKTVTGALVANSGTPSATPTANVKTVGNLSLGIVSVGAAQTVLIQSNVSQLEGSATDYSAVSFGDSSHLIRYNRTKGLIELSNNGADWYPLSAQGLAPIFFAIANGQSSAASVAGLVFDKTKFTLARFTAYCRRRTDSVTETVDILDMVAVYNTDLDTWTVTGEGYFADTGLVLSVVSATGQVQYTTTTLAGANYVGTLKIIDIKVG